MWLLTVLYVICIFRKQVLRMHLLCLVIVPILTVNVTSINNLTINGPLMLRCKVTTVRSIGSSVDIVWITNGSDINRTQFDVYPENTTFTDNYTIPNLTKEDNGTKYQCYAMINATILVNATGNYTVGKYQCLERGYAHQA